MVSPLKYWLAPHAHYCEVPEGVIFLDLRSGKYLGIPGQAVAALAGVVDEWPRRAEETADQSLNQSSVAESLVKAGLLVRSKPPQRVLERDASHVHRASSFRYIEYRQVTIGSRHVAYAIAACLLAAWEIKFRSLEAIVKAVATRKKRATKCNCISDLESVVAVADVFRRIRPYIFTAKDRCVFHTLSLLHFLALQNIFPSWVFGVQTSPWSPHTWLQHEDVVLDGTPESVFSFKPILVV